MRRKLNTRELRIGNLVDFCGSHYQVIKIQTEKAETFYGKVELERNGDAISADIPMLHGIRITNKILSKSNFVYDEDNNGLAYHFNCNEASFKWNICKGEVELFLHGHCMKNMAVKYVHQLQNIYYTLMGREFAIDGLQ